MQTDLEQELIKLSEHGNVHFSSDTGGWYCNVSLHSNTPGTNCSISSDFDMESPIKAVLQCKERLANALTKHLSNINTTK